MKKLLLMALVVLIFSSVIQAPAPTFAAEQSSVKCGTSRSAITAVMDFWYLNGYSATNDPHNLDDDNDGYPCNVSKAQYDFFLQAVNGWKFSGGKWYYYLPGSSTPYKGWLKQLGKWYYLDSKGVMKTGWLSQGGTWYYLNLGGAMVTGWLKNGQDWYYFDNGGGMKTGWVKDGTKWYYLETSGVMRTAPLKVGTTMYFFESSGAMKTGWISYGGKWYYYNENGLAKGWVLDKGDWYYLDASGVMKTGWIKYGNSWYYLSPNGTMKTGWFEEGNATYFLTSDGRMATGWTEIYSKRYYFYSNGNMARNTTIDGVELGADGAWLVSQLDRVQEVADKYGLVLEVLNEEETEFMIVDDVYEVVYGNVMGIVESSVGYADVGIDMALALGIPTTEDELAYEVYKNIDLNMDTDFNEWKINYVADRYYFTIYWGEGLQHMVWE
jgi:glucan-binding YG repeat protein